MPAFTSEMIMTTLYLTLVFILVSLDSVYNITHNIFGTMTSSDQTSYGVGMNFNEPGFIIHIIVFALLVVLPMMFLKR